MRPFFISIRILFLIFFSSLLVLLFELLLQRSQSFQIAKSSTFDAVLLLFNGSAGYFAFVVLHFFHLLISLTTDVFEVTQVRNEDALVIAHELEHKVRELAVPHASSSVDTVITISVGLATRPGSTDGDVNALLSLADSMLYKAKRTGRGRVCSAVLASTV